MKTGNGYLSVSAILEKDCVIEAAKTLCIARPFPQHGAEAAEEFTKKIRRETGL